MAVWPEEWIDGGHDYAQVVIWNIGCLSTSIDMVASHLGISAVSIAGGMAEEMDDYMHLPGALALHLLSDRAAQAPVVPGEYFGIFHPGYSHNDYLLSYQRYKDEIAAGADPREFNKLDPAYVAAVDTGFANINIATAIDSLAYYEGLFSGADPFNLLQYKTDYAALVDDLQDDQSGTSEKIAGLVMHQAEAWLSSHVANWNTLTSTEQNALKVYYYNVGEDYMQAKYDAAGHHGYYPNIDGTLIAQDHIANEAELINALGSSCGGGWGGDPGGTFPGTGPFLPRDPFVLDLDGDGIELISAANAGVFFDFDENGFAEQTGWLAADDGFLFLDENSDGVASGIGELFGNLEIDGFTELATLDTNGDGIISVADDDFSELKIWRDLNQDGLSTADEVFTIDALGISEIGLMMLSIRKAEMPPTRTHIQ